MRRLLGVQLAVIVGVTAMVAAQSQSAVADAARRGDHQTVRSLLKQGADVNAGQGDGMTALHWAAERGDVALVDMLLYAGANHASATRIGGYVPLHIASRSGQAPVVRALLKAGAAADRRTAVSGTTPLHLAAAAGSVDAVTALLDAGADIEAKENEWEQTPLIFAAAADRTDVVSLLIKRGAKVDQASRALEISKQQALDRQASQLQRQILQSSVARGEKPTAPGRDEGRNREKTEHQQSQWEQFSGGIRQEQHDRLTRERSGGPTPHAAREEKAEQRCDHDDCWQKDGKVAARIPRFSAAAEG